jgi:hypothetical protein
MSAFEHVKANLVGYLLPVAAMLMWGGFTAFMDARHEAKGAINKVEVRQLKREKRKLENYERLAPNSAYSSSRQAEIAALEDEIAELESQ